MKKYLIYLCIASLLGITACEDDFNKDNFKGLEEMTQPENVLDKDYKLTDADYTTISGLKVDGVESADLKAVLKNQYLTSATNPRVVLPAFLAKNWKTASLDATLRLTFNYVPDAPAYLAAIAGAGSYEVTAEDYKAIWGEENIDYLAPARRPEKYLPGILQKAVSEPKKDAYVIAAYQYSVNNPEGDWTEDEKGGELVEETFANGQGAFTVEDKTLSGALTYVWKHDSHGYMKASAYKDNTSLASESWLVSPAMDMSNVLNSAILTFEHAINYGDVASYAAHMTVWVSAEGGDWEQLTIPNIPEKGSWKFLESGDIDLSAYAGKTNVRIAFKYMSTDAAAATWEVKNVRVSGIISVFQPDLATNDGGFTMENKTLPEALSYVWKYDAKNEYMKASAYKSKNYAAESWLVSPAISLSDVEVPVLTFEHAINYGDVAFYAAHMTVWASAEGGDWQQLTIPNVPEKKSWDFIKSGDIDLSAYAGKTDVRIAFKYMSTDAAAATWEVKDILVKGLSSSSSDAASLNGLKTRAAVSDNTRYTVFVYDGTKWAAVENAVMLSSADYEAMGGVDGYFTADVPAGNYLPQFLSLKCPYSHELDTMVVVYNYSNATTLKADEYVLDGGVWKCNTQPVTEVTEQYALGPDGWVYSPDVTITLVPGKNAGTGHFQALTDWVWENIDEPAGTKKGEGYVTSYGNNDYYYGGSEYQNNFDFRPSAWKQNVATAYGSMSDEDLTALMWKRLPEGIEHMLDTKYPDVVQTDEPISYVVKFGIYGINGSSTTKYYSIRCKLVGKGKFSYVEDSLKEISSL